MRKRSGFTLIELLVVIAIIAILAAILFPVLLSAKKRASMVNCLNNLKQLSAGMRMYADDFNGMTPQAIANTGASKNWCGCNVPGGWVYPEMGQLWKYSGKNKKVFICSSDMNTVADCTTAPAGTGLTKKDFPLSYSMNYEASNCRIDTVARPSRMLILLHEKRHTDSQGMGINDGVAIITHPQDVPSTVHYNGTTVSYVDGHAKWASYDALSAERLSGAWNRSGVASVSADVVWY